MFKLKGNRERLQALIAGHCGTPVSRRSARGTNPHRFFCALPPMHVGDHKSARAIRLEKAVHT